LNGFENSFVQFFLFSQFLPNFAKFKNRNKVSNEINTGIINEMSLVRHRSYLVMMTKTEKKNFFCFVIVSKKMAPKVFGRGAVVPSMFTLVNYRLKKGTLVNYSCRTTNI